MKCSRVVTKPSHPKHFLFANALVWGESVCFVAQSVNLASISFSSHTKNFKNDIHRSLAGGLGKFACFGFEKDIYRNSFIVMWQTIDGEQSIHCRDSV